MALQPPLPSEIAKEIASIARGQHDKFHLIDENDEPLASQIKLYWEKIKKPFPGIETAWSAAFISYCVKSAKVKASDFKFSGQHSVFVNHAINSPKSFKGISIAEDQVNVGDIIQNNRNGHHFDFDYAKKHSDYESHSALVISRGSDEQGKFVITVGGNESDSIRQKRVRLNEDGYIVQRENNSYISLLKILI